MTIKVSTMQSQTTRTATTADLVEENCHELGQLERLLEGLSESDYQKRSGAQGQHTIGKHVRHIIDHYDAFLKSLHPASNGSLDYEDRERNTALETSPEVAVARLRELDAALRDHRNLGHETQLMMIHQAGEGHLTTPTSVGRELIFLSSHTIHHMAILGMLAEEAGLSLPVEFGVHPSTLRHWRKQQAQIGEAS